ncbi:ATP-binding cassette domain-containing protein [Rhodobacter sphaeroides]|uniref:ABC transporter ATP-binding protein n=1 Tax=Cereibacter sphaeroides TaxID=1063 RepID=UPI0013239982|nr:ABC transporter ATP-binding protein [Cereibacter sphaeroides]MWP39271.1 ATP-binding cassette domain-containing protein [Cereibacter sphaeroides]
MTHSSPEFDLRQASVQIAGQQLLEGLDLRIARGSVTGILGPNGSGKSTLMRLMTRQLAPSAGQVLFRGRPLAAYAASDFARQLAHLPQTPPHVPGLTVAELVALGRFPWHGAFGRFGAEDRARQQDALRQAGLADQAESPVETLSGGERQRAWIAMLLAQGAGCLLLDEPTSALDPAHQIEVLSLLRGLNRRQGLTVVMVLHDVNLAGRFCDDLVALRAGKILDSGPVADIMQPVRLQRIYDLPMLKLPHPDSGRALVVPREKGDGAPWERPRQ